MVWVREGESGRFRSTGSSDSSQQPVVSSPVVEYVGGSSCNIWHFMLDHRAIVGFQGVRATGSLCGINNPSTEKLGSQPRWPAPAGIALLAVYILSFAKARKTGHPNPDVGHRPNSK
jgi:hypothetical protein